VPLVGAVIYIGIVCSAAPTVFTDDKAPHPIELYAYTCAATSYPNVNEYGEISSVDIGIKQNV
jgi:hypothetical protein